MSETPAANLLAVVFDLDDTLYPERDYVRSGYRAAADHLRRRVNRGEAFEDWLWRRFCAGQSAGAFDAMNESLALHLSAQQIGQLVDVYRCHRPEIQPFPGVRGLLERLRGRYRLGLLSDGYLPAQQLKLEALGLADLFHAVLFTETLGRAAWKPSPAGFVEMARRLDAPHERCAYVADNAAKDFLAPNRLGWWTIQYAPPGAIHAEALAPPNGKPHIVVASPGELARALGLD